jgi:2-methylisocitrate lyase-like PEP mutase family enzyme
MTQTQKFRNLHNTNELLHIGNVWDTNSALIIEAQGYKALGTSSFAIAKSLGYEDGEQMCFDELFNIVKQIISKVNLPITVDIEGGYSRDINKITKNIKALFDLGVVGINIEDSIVKDGQREIMDQNDFTKILQDIKHYLQNNKIDIFINARTDYYIMGLDNPLENTIQRIKQYEKTGIDGIFVPALVNIEDIKQIVHATSLPINVMTMPDLDRFKILKDVGVKRISQGPFLYNNLMEKFENTLKQIKKDDSFESLFNS